MASGVSILIGNVTLPKDAADYLILGFYTIPHTINHSARHPIKAIIFYQFLMIFQRGQALARRSQHRD
jgi:hypothetical protein